MKNGNGTVTNTTDTTTSVLNGTPCRPCRLDDTANVNESFESVLKRIKAHALFGFEGIYKLQYISIL